MGKWSRYDKAFQSAWLKDPLFEKWLEVKNEKWVLARVMYRIYRAMYLQSFLVWPRNG